MLFRLNLGYLTLDVSRELMMKKSSVRRFRLVKSVEWDSEPVSIALRVPNLTREPARPRAGMLDPLFQVQTRATFLRFRAVVAQVIGKLASG
jgi:hypothetical protein